MLQGTINGELECCICTVCVRAIQHKQIKNAEARMYVVPLRQSGWFLTQFIGSCTVCARFHIQKNVHVALSIDCLSIEKNFVIL